MFDSGEARGPGSLGGPGSWYSHAQTAHRSLSSRDPLPFPLPKEVQEVGRGPGRKGVPARRGVGVPARGVLRPVRGQEAWEYHEPGPPNEPGPLTLSLHEVCFFLPRGLL